MEAQRLDAYRDLGVATSDQLLEVYQHLKGSTMNQSLSPHKTKIYFWHAGSEVISVAIATYEVAKAIKADVELIVVDPVTRAYSKIVEVPTSWNKKKRASQTESSVWNPKYVLVPIKLLPNDIHYFYHDNTASKVKGDPRLHGNAPHVKNISENKFQTSEHLSQVWIHTPEQILLPVSRFDDYWKERTLADPGKMDTDIYDHTQAMVEEGVRYAQSHKDYAAIERFFQKIGRDKRVVLKPNAGQQWSGIKIFDYPTFVAQKDDILEFLRKTNMYDGLLIQKKEDSYKIEKDGKRLDWNARVLVTYDFNKKEYICAGIVIRIDIDGAPVNRSISADAITLEKIAQMCSWDEATYSKVKRSFEETAIKATKRLVDVWLESMQHVVGVKERDPQVLTGVDIICNEDLQSCTLEVNDINSGCMHELRELYSTKALHCIGQCVIDKATISHGFSSLANGAVPVVHLWNIQAVIANGENI
jgi:hypothetical protein